MTLPGNKSPHTVLELNYRALNPSIVEVGLVDVVQLQVCSAPTHGTSLEGEDLSEDGVRAEVSEFRGCNPDLRILQVGNEDVDVTNRRRGGHANLQHGNIEVREL